MNPPMMMNCDDNRSPSPKPRNRPITPNYETEERYRRIAPKFHDKLCLIYDNLWSRNTSLTVGRTTIMIAGRLASSIPGCRCNTSKRRLTAIMAPDYRIKHVSGGRPPHPFSKLAILCIIYQKCCGSFRLFSRPTPWQHRGRSRPRKLEPFYKSR